ncbi:putative phosphoglycerate mutase pmu1 [Ophidiomyces ophidiicola]|nr:putative phosphoglycerate mutase pmu1 [Ophidiomyces ophidiicola]
MNTSPGLFVTIAVAVLVLAMNNSVALYHWEYSTVLGYFLQDDPSTDPATFDYVSTAFGLINKTYDTDASFDPDRQKSQWDRFTHKLHAINQTAPANVKYTLLFLGRHGQGYHNVAESYYGTAAWDCYWSMLDGNGSITWTDAHLTDQGILDAQIASQAWATQIEGGIPVPESYYTSPLYRCLQTANITFGTLSLPQHNPFIPTVKELLRETIGIHTCDRRSSREYISNSYPSYSIEPGFAQSDPLWVSKLRESLSATKDRLRTLLDDVFTHDQNTFLSMTAHGGAITAILEVVGHRKFPLVTGAVIPVLVRAEKKPGRAPPRVIEPWEPPPKCAENPTATPLIPN